MCDYIVDEGEGGVKRVYNGGKRFEDIQAMMNITIQLPDELVKQAQAAGILTDDQVASLLQTELERRQRQDKYFADLEALRNLQPPLSEAEIEAEMKAFKQERAANRRK